MHDIGVVVALPREAATLGTVHPHAGHVAQIGGWRVVVSGIGAQRAQRAAGALLADGAGALLSWGVAGGLQAALQPGDLVLADGVASTAGEASTSQPWRQQWNDSLEHSGLRVAGGLLWSSANMVTSVREKRELAARGYVAVDMESAAVAAVATRAGVPFAAIRAVCDPHARVLPAFAAKLMRPDGRIRPGAVAMAGLRGPRAWRAMADMRRDFQAACASLRRAARSVARP